MPRSACSRRRAAGRPPGVGERERRRCHRPDGGEIAAEIPVGVAPGGVAAGAGAIWVTNTGGNSVSRIDPETNEVRQTIPVGGGPAGLAVGGDAVWVANGLDGTVTRIDAETNLPSQTITVGNGPTGVAYGKAPSG